MFTCKQNQKSNSWFTDNTLSPYYKDHKDLSVKTVYSGFIRNIKNVVCTKHKFINIDPLKTREAASESEETASRGGTWEALFCSEKRGEVELPF